MPTLQEQAEDLSCEPCRFATGIGFMANLCNELKSDNIDCGELVNQVKSGEIKVNDFVDQLEGKISNATNDYKNKENALQLFHKIKNLMFEKRPIEVKEAKDTEK